jgi:3-deoxy-7-phosphoheptulonate synthase
MHQPTFDLRIRAQKPLVAPAVLEEELPLSDAGAVRVAQSRREVAEIVTGKDDRLLVVVGPCSIHDPDSAREYAARLRECTAIYSRDLLLVMRVYFEKPRTVVGWKGLINDPFLDGSYQINTGLRLARGLMRDVVELGLPVATEFLDTTLGQYYADLVSWGAIGARTVESQVHRELASGLSMPVGFKNRTDGEVRVAIDAIRSARHPHWFPSLTREGAPAVLGTTGNEHAHLVLRGGSSGPNFSADKVEAAAALLRAAELPAHVMIDCSHANSGKDPAKQLVVAADIASQLAGGSRTIVAAMLESNLVGGAQDYRTKPLVPGRSITDACLAWEQTLPVLGLLADAVRQRRQGH